MNKVTVTDAILPADEFLIKPLTVVGWWYNFIFLACVSLTKACC